MSRKPKKNEGIVIEMDGVRAQVGKGQHATLSGDINAGNLKRNMAEAVSAAPVTFPMTPGEAHEIGKMEEQRGAILAALNAAEDAFRMKVCARLGLAIGTKLHADPQRGVYTVG